MSDFNSALAFVLKHEGGYVNDPNDAGGATNFGISLRYLKDLVKQYPELIQEFSIKTPSQIDKNFIKNISFNAVQTIYQHFWWDKYGYGYVNDQKLATKIFDVAVNIGPNSAIKILQQALCKIYELNKMPIQIDLPHNIFKYANGLSEANISNLLKIYCSLIAGYYNSLVKKNPNNAKYIKGWLNRAYDC